MLNFIVKLSSCFKLVSGLASFLLPKFFLIFFSALHTINIQAASSLVRSTGSEISDMLNNFDEFHQEACEWASPLFPQLELEEGNYNLVRQLQSSP